MPALQDNIYISDANIPANEDMHKLLHSADLGLALYGPNYLSMWTGKNLALIGMGSGKISVYLQHGLPVVTTYNEVLTPLIQSHGLGYTVGSTEELFSVLQQHEPSPEQNKRCIKFFEERLSFNLYKSRLMGVVQKCVEKGEQPRFWDAARLFRSVRESLVAQEENIRWTFADVYRSVEELKRTGEKFVVYGEGALGLTIQALMPENVVAFVHKTGFGSSPDFVGGEIHSSWNLPGMTYDRVIIGVPGQESQVEDHLVNELAIPKEKIVQCPN